MRQIVLGLAAALIVAGAAFAQSPADNPLLKARGTAIAPSGQTAIAPAAAPPEGVGAGGLDFGAWKGADAAAYGPSFERRVRAHVQGKPVSGVRAALQSDGFQCVEPKDRGGAGPALDCRIAVRDGACGVEWWAVVEDPLQPPKAGYDRMCR